VSDTQWALDTASAREHERMLVEYSMYW